MHMGWLFLNEKAQEAGHIDHLLKQRGQTKHSQVLYIGQERKGKKIETQNHDYILNLELSLNDFWVLLSGVALKMMTF